MSQSVTDSLTNCCCLLELLFATNKTADSPQNVTDHVLHTLYLWGMKYPSSGEVLGVLERHCNL